MALHRIPIIVGGIKKRMRIFADLNVGRNTIAQAPSD
jgi:hypothetical protein